MRVRLVKIKSSHSNLRTDEIVGDAAQLPKIGYPFIMSAEPLETAAGMRYVKTSTVTMIDGEVFHTLNSEYRLEVLSDPAIKLGAA